MRIDLFKQEKFQNRHLGPDEEQVKEMLQTIGVDSMDSLINKTIPKNIRLKEPLQLPSALSEHDFLKHIKEVASRNNVYRSFIGMGYYDTIVPNVIKRNIFENPGWYTSYTPYQAEIAQGRLEMLVNFQTMVIDLTGMELANASLLDEGTAAAEAMSMLFDMRKGAKKKANVFFVSDNCHPQTIEVLKTRSEPLDIELKIGNHELLNGDTENVFGALLQYPGTDGSVIDYTDIIKQLHEQDILAAVAADLLSLTLLKAPGEMDADVVVGSSQRFGVPLGYGGPHAAFFATRESYKRKIPGRIIGVTVDAEGNPAFRMALQTREQHIRREKATSNICTAQVLLAVMAAAYGVYHGPEGLRRIARRIYGLTGLLKKGLETLGFTITNKSHFDTLTIDVENDKLKGAIRNEALTRRVNVRYFDDTRIGISLDEKTTFSDVDELLKIFAHAVDNKSRFDVNKQAEKIAIDIPDGLKRASDFMTHEVFNSFHSEHEMLRYLKKLENRDLSLVHSMISLGSCTMKLNATAEMIPVSWTEFAGLHPFVPKDQAEGYEQLINDLESWLCRITGFHAVTLQPNSGAQGEFTGLMLIRAYHKSRGDDHRKIALIPSSAHGTNPASAVMAGMKVVVVACDENGNIDVPDLKKKAEDNADNLAALMVTYPSTHGVFEEDIKEICKIIHDNGGQVYMDGANMNAQVGLTSPAVIGADVCHLNLHKTFTIPHGGGGPGVGPIGVAEHLTPFLPGHIYNLRDDEKAIPAVTSAPWGSASILPISYAYINMMGSEGLKKASEYAILNANYLKVRLQKYYPVLYTGANGFSAHEFIIDMRQFKPSAGVEVIDVAKRLMDYGFHAPTVSFPVPGTMMIEPTESESLEELDRFCEAMISIRKEIQEIEDGKADKEDNVLKNAPHTAYSALAGEWNHPYSREKACYPLEWLKDIKFWTSVARVDDAYGDRNLVCSCPPMEDYMHSSEEPEKVS